ncbi:hypothetical protein LTR22_024479 [Elasticomyces elasticus]|nr:hypothetical protein LTR22_024479 [Elasticomyces elasticus]
MGDTVSVRRVIVAGASGNLGPAILKALKDDARFSVSVLTRESSTSSFPRDVTVHSIPDSYPEEEIFKAFQHQDAVVSLIGMAHALQQLQLIEAAAKAGVKHFIPAEYGANKEVASKQAGPPNPDNKAKIIQLLKTKERSGMAWTAIATGPFFDWGLQVGLLGFNLKAYEARPFEDGDVQWTGTTLPTVGLAVARVLERPSIGANQFIYVYSVRTSQNEILRELEKQTRRPWVVHRASVAEAVKEGRAKLAQGDSTGVIPVVQSTFMQEGVGADYTRDVAAVNDELGLKAEALEDLVRQAISNSGK